MGNPVNTPIYYIGNFSMQKEAVALNIISTIFCSLHNQNAAIYCGTNT